MSALFIWQSPINENNGKKEWHAQLQKTFRGARVLTQRHFQKQKECPHLVQTLNTLKWISSGNETFSSNRPSSAFTDVLFLPVALPHF